MAFTKLQRDVADIYEQVVSMATRHEPHACADPNPNPDPNPNLDPNPNPNPNPNLTLTLT